MRSAKSALILLFLCLFSLAFDACEKKVAIVHELTEREANRILVLLARHDIGAAIVRLEKSQKVEWSLTVKAEDEVAARSILVANNLPKVKHGGLSGICKDTPLIMSPETEKCRRILAYKEEIINSLESIKGVVSADVVLNIPDAKSFADDEDVALRPTAAVTVQYLQEPHTVKPLNEGQVQEFVSKSISNLDARDVTVIITFLEPIAEEDNAAEEVAKSDAQTTVPAQNGIMPNANAATMPPVEGGDSVESYTMIGGLKMDDSSAKKFKVVAVLFLVLFLLLTAAFIFVLLRMARLKKHASVVATPADGDDIIDQKLLGT